MNDSDIEIVLALAQGRLSGQAEQDALSRIEADPELANELAIQIDAIKLVQSVSSPAMTAVERSTLHANLIEQLHLEPTSAPAAPVRRKLSWWQPVVGLASVAALVLAIVVVPDMFDSSNDSSGADFAVVARESPTGEGGTGAGEFSTTTAAASSVDSVESFDQPASGADDGSLVDVGFLNVYEVTEQDLPDLLDIVVTERSSPELSDEKLARSRLSAFAPIELAVVTSCLDTLSEELPDAELIPLGVTTGEGGQVVHFGVDPGTGVDRLVSVDLDACSVVGTTP